MKYANIELAKRFTMEQTPLLYAATDDVFYEGNPNYTKEDLPPAITIEQAQELMNYVQRSEYSQAHWPKFARAPQVRVDNDTARQQPYFVHKYSGAFTDPYMASKGQGPVHVGITPDWAQSVPAVLHEAGHVIYYYERGLDAFKREMWEWRGHGPQFARLNLELVGAFCSPEKAAQLKNAFQYAGVKI